MDYLEALRAKMAGVEARTLGYCRRGGPAGQEPVTASIPGDLRGQAVSFCGVKGFMIDEVRAFRRRGEAREEEVACAMVAVLEIEDSPVHLHAQTMETYTILEGEGRMVLGDTVVEVRKGSVIAIPPGNEHGLCSAGEGPVKALMTFSPGLAPRDREAYRDEAGCGMLSSERVAELAGRDR